MSVISSASLLLKSTFSSGTSGTNFDGPIDAETAVINGITYLYVSAVQNDTIQIFTVDDAGALTPVGAIVGSASIPNERPLGMTTFELGGVPYLAVANQDVLGAGSAGDGALVVFALSDTAPFMSVTDVVRDSDIPQAEIRGAAFLISFEAGGETYLTASGIENGFSTFRIEAGGTLVNVQNENVISSFFGGRVYLSELVEFNGAHYMVATAASTSSSSDDLVLYRFDTATEDFVELASRNYPDNTQLGQANVTVDGGELAIFVTVRDHDAELLTFDPTFLSLRLRANVDLDGAQVLNVRTHNVDGDTYFLLANGPAGDVEVYEFDGPNGEVNLLQRINDGTGQGILEGVGYGTPFENNGRMLLPVLSGTFEAVNLYEIGGADDWIEGTLGADQIFGLGGDDVITARNGNDTINGGLDTDIIYAGSGDDLILLSPGEDQIFGGSGIDTVTLSDLVVTEAVTIDFLRNEIVLPGGEIQFVTDVERAIASPFDDTLIGDDVGNGLFGGTGDDLIRARGGNDFVQGNEGNDQIFGAGGNDQLYLGDGDDLANGGDGVDFIIGGDGADRIFGGAGLDQINGGADDDLIKGNDGDDEIFGAGGNDTIFGQSGDDFLEGGDGMDVIMGGSGRDLINPGAGNDTITGGSAADVFQFFNVGNEGGGVNTITDFKHGIDRLDLRDYGFASFAQVMDFALPFGDDVAFAFLDSQQIIVEDTTLADFSASDFIL